MSEQSAPTTKSMIREMLRSGSCQAEIVAALQKRGLTLNSARVRIAQERAALDLPPLYRGRLAGVQVDADVAAYFKNAVDEFGGTAGSLMVEALTRIRNDDLLAAVLDRPAQSTMRRTP